jgi:hypothetical protein
MTGIKKMKLRLRLIAVLLLFVNVLCTAAPTLQALAVSENSSNGIFTLHNNNFAEVEEEQVLTSNYTVRRNTKERILISFLTASFRQGNNLNSKLVNYYISYSSLFPLPDYYAFLFRFNLF